MYMYTINTCNIIKLHVQDNITICITFHCAVSYICTFYNKWICYYIFSSHGNSIGYIKCMYVCVKTKPIGIDIDDQSRRDFNIISNCFPFVFSSSNNGFIIVKQLFCFNAHEPLSRQLSSDHLQTPSIEILCYISSFTRFFALYFSLTEIFTSFAQIS